MWVFGFRVRMETSLALAIAIMPDPARALLSDMRGRSVIEAPYCTS